MAGNAARGASAWYASTKSRARALFLEIRPLVMLLEIVVGLWWTHKMLSQYPWHHMMIAWVAGAFIAGYGIVGLYKELRNRLVVREWLVVAHEASGNEPEELREALRALPERHRQRVVKHRRALKQARKQGQPPDAVTP